MPTSASTSSVRSWICRISLSLSTWNLVLFMAVLRSLIELEKLPDVPAATGIIRVPDLPGKTRSDGARPLPVLNLKLRLKK
jgi:hypothetical protein